MASRHGTEFRREAVRLALTSGLTRKQIAADLGVGFSTLNKWVQQDRDKELMTGPHEDQEKEITRLRKEDRILREEREILKKATGLLREPKMMRFAFIEAWRKTFPIHRMCKVLRVTSRGYRAWRCRPMSQRQRDDMVLLAHTGVSR